MKIPKKYHLYNYILRKQISEAKNMRRLGYSYGKIGEILGFSHTVIMYHLCPEQREKALLRHLEVSPEIKRQGTYRYQKRFEKVTGIDYSTQYDREHKTERNKVKLEAYYRGKNKIWQ